MKIWTLIIFLLLTVSCSKSDQDSNDHSAHEHQSVEEYYTCSMHPEVREDKPGKCPICHMNLTKIKVDKSQKQSTSKEVNEKIYACESDHSITSMAPGECPLDGSSMIEISSSDHQFGHTLKSVRLSATQLENFKAKTFSVSTMAFEKTVRLLGEVVQAQQKESNIPLRFDGRIEKVYVTSEGEYVRTGDVVAEVYAPSIISSGEEYIVAKLQSLKEPSNRSYKELITQAEQRLLNWGISRNQLNEWFEQKSVPQKIAIHAQTSGIVTKRFAVAGKYFKEGQSLFDVVDLSTVWVELDVYEVDSALVEKNQTIELRFAALPGRTVEGKIDFVSPVIDPQTRTLKIRTTIDNSNGELKIGMVADGALRVAISNNHLVIPKSAVVDTGKRQLVWLQTSADEFEARLVNLGIAAGDYVQVLEGLKENDAVVARGNFMLDAQAQLFGGEISHQH